MPENIQIDAMHGNWNFTGGCYLKYRNFERSLYMYEAALKIPEARGGVH